MLPATAQGLELIFHRLTHTEAKLLRRLLDRLDHLSAREELLSRIWGDRGKDTSSRCCIWQLRRKLSEFSSARPSPKCCIEILNLNGMGYLLKITLPAQGATDEAAPWP